MTTTSFKVGANEGGRAELNKRLDQFCEGLPEGAEISVTLAHDPAIEPKPMPDVPQQSKPWGQRRPQTRQELNKRRR